MPEILRVPIAPTGYRDDTTYRNSVAGGFSTSFIELPYNYIIGGFEYSKELLASVKNGHFGLYSDTYSDSLANYPNNQTAAPQEAYLDAGIVHANLLGYFGGAVQTISSLAQYVSKNSLQLKGLAFGTIGRKVKPMAYIRDINDSSIVYILISGPNQNYLCGFAKVNTKSKEMLWRHATTETTPNFGNVWGTVDLTGSAFSLSTVPVEYLYQDAESLYVLCGGPKTNNHGFNPTSVYIYSVNKNTGAILEVTYFNLYTLGVITQTPCYLNYKFLGMIDPSRFLIEIQQLAGPATENANLAANTINPANGNNCVYNALVVYDTSDLTGKVLWSSPALVPDTAANNSNSITNVYPITGSLIIDELSDSLFLPMSSMARSRSVSAETIIQVFLNKAHDEVIGTTPLPVVGPYGAFKTISVGDLDAPTSLYNHDDKYVNPVLSMEQRAYVASPTVTSQNASTMSRFSNLLQGYGLTTILFTGDYTTVGSVPWSTCYRYKLSSYDHMSTIRSEPILRVHGICPEGPAKKTILPCGEDLISQGTLVGAYGNNAAIGQIFRYTSQACVAQPWGVIVSHDGFTLYNPNNNTAYTPLGSCFGLTPRDQGYPRAYANATTEINHPDDGNFAAAIVYWVGTLPGCSYTLRRSGTELNDCAIYYNNGAFPIHAVSYSITPNIKALDAAPISWYVEAHDVETDTWVEVDRQENVALPAPPPLVFRGDALRLSRARLHQQPSLDYDTKLYRTYFKFNDIETKCPKGAHAFRITFTDSCNGSTVVVGSWMIQEKPWPWKQAQAPEATYTNISNKAYAYTCIGVTQSANANSTIGTTPYINAATQGAAMPYLPSALSVIGPRVEGHLPALAGYNSSSTNAYYMAGLGLYSTNTTGVNNIALNLSFAEPIEICGVQFSMMGLRTPINAGHTKGSCVPGSIKIEASVDDANWTLVSEIPLEKLPGLTSSYVDNAVVWSKTYLYEFDTPGYYKSLRATCVGDSPDSSSIPADMKRTWTIHNLSAFQPRDSAFAGKAIPMQSILDKHNFLNTSSGPEFNNTALFEGNGTNTPACMWDPWWTIHPSVYGAVPTGFSWGGFDAHGTLNSGYWACGGRVHDSTNTANYIAKQDIICNAGYITASQSVVLMASWKGFMERQITTAMDGTRPLKDYYQMTYLSDDQLFSKAVYSDRVKVTAYSFIKSNCRAVTVGAPYRWNVYGSVDGTTWDLIDARTKTDWSTAETVLEFPVNNPGWYIYYKWEFLETSDGGLNLLSIDTFIEGIDESTPYVHTIYPKNCKLKADSSITVSEGTTVRGLLGKEHLAWAGTSHPVHLSYVNDKVTLIIDQKVSVDTHSVFFALNPSMDDLEMPNHVTIEGSNDNSTWTEMLDDQNVDWSTDPLYRKRLTCSTPGKYRYIKVIFHKPQIPTEGIPEYWLLNTQVVIGNSGDVNRYHRPSYMSVFKIKSGEMLVHTSGYVGTPLANLWISESSVATVMMVLDQNTSNITIRKLNPITQEMDITRTISAPTNSHILGTALDTGKNIWYWVNTGSQLAWNATLDGSSGMPDGYCALCVHANYSANAVKVKFDENIAKYSGSPLLLKLHTWIEDTTITSGENRVGGNVKLVLSGGDAKFVSTGSDTVTVTVNAGSATEVEFTASGPDRVNVVATLLK